MRVLFPVHLLQSFRFLKKFKQVVTRDVLNLQGLCNENFSKFECSFFAPIRTTIEISTTAVPYQLQTVPFLPLAENYLSTLDDSKATLGLDPAFSQLEYS
jgi:hypothetical protein